MSEKFPDLKFEQIKFFNHLLQKTKTNQFEWIKNEYSNKYNNFQELYSLLLKLKLIVNRKNKILLMPSVHSILVDIFLINSLKYSDFSEHLQDYLGSFNTLDNHVIYNPTRVEKVKFSNIRNFLIEAGYIKYNTNSSIYLFLPKKYQELKKILVESNSIINPDLLKVIQKKQEELGHSAELTIMKYEKKRLNDYPDLQTSLIHTAKYNSSAGYDIKSWNTSLKDSHSLKERYIEVKAVSVNDFKFYWSRNEIEKAKKYGTQYYLYLLPVINSNEFDVANLKIISDPYSNVFLSDKWDQQVENYLFNRN